MITPRMLDFLKNGGAQTPCLVVDTDIVKANYREFATALPETRIFYAVKANPLPGVLQALAVLGSCFDTASIPEIKAALAAGATPQRISFGNTIKKARDIEEAYQLGIRLFAVDCNEEVEKIAQFAPGSQVFCRLLCDGQGAQWPLSRKFGCTPEMAVDVLCHAKALKLDPYGVSFHVGSQQTDLTAWDRAVKDAAWVFSAIKEKGISLKLINFGGGFPIRYLEDVPGPKEHAEAIRAALKRYLPDGQLDIIVEPGRGMVGNSGVIRTEVVLISHKGKNEKTRWVYLDIGKYNGLPETIEEAIRYNIITPYPRDSETSPCILAGPTCDSTDVLYEKCPYALPTALKIGDILLIPSTGAYTSSYASVDFNGFEPLKAYVI